MQRSRKFFAPFLFVLLVSAVRLTAADVPPPVVSATEKAIAYYDATELKNDYQKEQCKLDITYPTNRPGFATLIWFHGGGLTKGSRNFPKIDASDIACVTVDYRLSPKVECPGYLEDAAAATAWVIRNIEKYGGNPKEVFISGHSAGGYLAMMIGMDPRWLAKENLSNHQLAGIIPVSGQATTHFLIKKLRGDTGEPLRPLIDEYAPLYYASKNLPPICLIVGDRKIDWKCRVEENQLLAATLRSMGHPMVEFWEMGGLGHGGVEQGGAMLIPPFIRRVLGTGGALVQPGP